ncbi:MAG: tetratricopeptide repeat protein [Verrucomicrobiales bacterium]|jgi:tetratricopeptide (TPR) repeat protein|nr:tetratricopeptide repeat protein [Verrucomicrobiales bacterium]
MNLKIGLGLLVVVVLVEMSVWYVTTHARQVEKAYSSRIKSQALSLMDEGNSAAGRKDQDSAIICYTAAINLQGLSPEVTAKALINRGITEVALRRLDNALYDYSTVIGMPDASVGQMSTALLNRGCVYGEQEKFMEAATDFTRIIDMKDAPAETLTKAYFNRAQAYGELGDRDKEMADFAKAIELPDGAMEYVVKSLYFRGRLQNELALKMADFKRALDLSEACPDVPSDLKARILISRATIYADQNDLPAAIVDLTRVIEGGKASPEWIAGARLNRGQYYRKQGERHKAILDLQAVWSMMNIPRDISREAEKALDEMKAIGGRHYD